MTTGQDWVRPVVHFQIDALDPVSQAEFYRRLFNWDSGEDGSRPFPAGIGSPEPGPGGHFRAAGRPGATLYVQVRDIHETVSLAEELGAKVKRTPVLNAGVTSAFIEDPEGNGIVVVQQQAESWQG